MDDLQGKVVIVTGAAGAIGAAVSAGLRSRGARVTAVDTDRAALDAVGASDDGFLPVVADVADEDDCRRYVDATRARWGRVDGFFNNAGIIGDIAPLDQLPTDVFDRVMAVNVRGVFLGLKHVLAAMAEGGAIVNTASVAGVVGAAGLGPYVASKHAVIGLTRTAALEAAGRGIRVNAVLPGRVAGRMMDRIDAAVQARADAVGAVIPAGRYGAPDEIAHVVLFLLSGASSYVTGSSYVVDGGRTIG